MTRTFYGYDNSGAKVFFSLLSTGGDMFTARRKAMEVCDKNGWTLGKALWM